MQIVNKPLNSILDSRGSREALWFMLRADDYLDRLKQYRSVHKGLRKYVRIPKEHKSILAISYGKPMYTYMHLCHDSSITIPMKNDHNKPFRRWVDDIDRAIIFNRLVLMMDKHTGYMKIGHLVTPEGQDNRDWKYPIMPLSEYIHYMEDGIETGTINPAKKIRVSKWPVTAMTTFMTDFNHLENPAWLPGCTVFARTGCAKSVSDQNIEDFFWQTAQMQSISSNHKK